MATSIWERLESGVVVVPYTSLDDLKSYREAIRDTGLNVNNCLIIAVVKTKKEREVLSQNSVAVFISEKDFNILGRLKNPEALKTLGRKYDLVLFIGDQPKRVRRMVAKTMRLIRVGVNSTDPDNHVNLETTGQSPSHLISFVYEMLKKIS
ncbi:MAG: hypothetical protein A3D92_24140 [Bacteroidetes bacterium RIFCSPHIGHO2_02_FULL_44_7]|nr:MAG: hypothetical protein A3D92_24140 [Bacteroidetes bacterium RIFCSPHIGHO2_02_FULL_44_7]